VELLFDPIASSIEYIKSGKIPALTVTSMTRSVVFPDILTVSEFVPGFEENFWVGLGAAKKVPTEIIAILNGEINLVLTDPNLKIRLADLGGSPLGGPPAEFGNLIAAETEKWPR
jgi:tripartite-type tricarboxylate transporter receptor subunit TctC